LSKPDAYSNSRQNLTAILADITALHVDAIVNAANQTLLGGGGVDGAIHRAAGPRLLEECRGLGGCETGMAKITAGYNLPSKYVIHTVGPVWYGGNRNEPSLLASCYLSSLQLALENGCSTIAFPCISTGVFNYPSDAAAEIAVGTCETFLDEHGFVLKVTFVCFSEDDLDIYRKLLGEVS
jgi:O-acetyl-ADP-ribose deacetylase (regulator of RNase III)